MVRSVAAVAACLALAAALPAASVAQERPSVVLVHGATMDGSAWRPVYDRLAVDGTDVEVVQLPMETLEGDVAATVETISRTDGPVVLVGHSYGGAVISAAGASPRVRALVYIAALQPDTGETSSELLAKAASEAKTVMVDDVHFIIDPASYAQSLGVDLPGETTDFLARAQHPTNAAINTTPQPVAAWHDKPSWAVVATADRVVGPELERFMAERAGSTVVETDASHLVLLSQPDAVAEVIRQAVAEVANR